VTALNATLAMIVDGVLYPLRGLPPLAGVAAMSLLTAIGMLIVFKRTSDQQRIVSVKRAIHGSLFEIRLFADDARAILRSQADLLRQNAVYLRLSIVPALWLIVPLGLLMAQLQFQYGYAGLRPGESALVKVTLRAEQPGELALHSPPGLRVDTPPVWIRSLREAAWRISAEHEGEYELTVTAGGETATKTVRVSAAPDRAARRTPARLEAGFLNELFHPAERPLPAGGTIVSIEVTYPVVGIDVFGWEVDWMIVFFALSILIALVLRRSFGVNF
jgi:hypothetical protein